MMIFAHLARHWRARRQQYSLVSWLLCIARSLRVLLFYREHRLLCQLDVYRNYAATSADEDLFNHLSHREYLVKDLSVRQRVGCALTHYSFEEATFNSAYRHAVYLAGGLALWRHSANGSEFVIKLQMASRLNAEGDLTIALEADGKCLHRLSFSWVEGGVAGVAGLAGMANAIVPFVTRNQGRWIDSELAFGAFEQAFPNNSPSFFCFAAMQGLAQAVDMAQLVAVKTERHVAFQAGAPSSFANAYDRFWKILGGIELPGSGHLIALPFYVKPLAEIATKHRKRAIARREHWRQIGESARATVQRHLLHARAQHSHSAAAGEPTGSHGPLVVK